ncbi:uncharacterized protein SPSK_04017 [Sporothrix schenckii 1099-18]|uniref:F-box domain-containing protein n=1 Tax=Sporothrix schenckii 1099-18 TaxID=1397361 RepID=A0A0F2M6R8_SPOSC|nr:uncharacterized protein SPSK_04017 [Sporothrix schenckii 1099-18]KJR83866.1 hypothetical protein SPSK_04017 [Sporothrix schenckii 1099-18]
MADDHSAGDAAVGPEESKSAAAAIDTKTIAVNRKAYLLSLVPDLTLDEIWMLQERLAKLDLRTDIFARLPPELQFMVADSLGPADLGCCLHVSSMWRSAFLHESMRKDLARRCFPSLLEYVDAVRTEMAKAGTDGAVAQRDETTERTESTGDSNDTKSADNAEGTDIVDNTGAAGGQNEKDHNAHVDLIFSETARKYALRALGRFRYVFRHCRTPPFTVAEKAAARIAGKPVSEVTASESTWLDQGRPLARRRNKIRQRRQQQQQQQQQQPEPSYGMVYAEAVQRVWQPPRPHDLFQNRADPALDLHSDEDDEDDEDDGVVSFHGADYAYGRLAWQCLRNNDTWFLVDDLRDGRRLPLCVPNDHRRGDSFLLVGFGDELLLAASGHRILAWNFVTGEQQDKQLPAQMDTVQTLGKRTCILADGHVYFWEFGGMLREVDMSGLDEKHRQPDVDGRLPSFFILDPVNEAVFYLGNFELDGGQMGRNGKLSFHLHMFDDLRYKETFSDHIHFDNYAFPRCLIEATVRRNARGLYSLASWRAGSGAPGPTRSVSTGEVVGVASLAFNIYTKTFSLSFFSLPPATPAAGREGAQLIRIHIWNDQVITIVDRYRDAPQGKVLRSKPLLFAFDDEYSEAARCSAAKPFSKVPLYTSTVDDEDDMDEFESNSKSQDATGATSARPPQAHCNTHVKPELRQQVRFDGLDPGTPGQWLQDDDDWTKNNCLLRFALDVDSSPSRADPYRPAHIGSYFMQGDDDFLVFRHDNEYTIWSFRDDIVHSVAHSDETAGGAVTTGDASAS